MKTLILTGGGTAGHVTPLLSVLPYVKTQFDKVIYIGSGKAIEEKLIKPTGIEIFNSNPPAFIRSLTPKNLTIPVKLAKSVKKCLQILQKENATVVFSKGGYCALPVCLAAFKLKIPVVCHESDLTIGLANRLTKKRCSCFFTSFESTAKKYDAIYSGPPLREDLFTANRGQAKQILGIKNNKPTLLVTGGSQGSKTLNRAIIKNLPTLCKNFNVVHLCGKGNKSGYKSINGYFEFEFIDMRIAIAASDYCVTRGGSNTLFELLYAKKTCIAVPLKKGSRGDQVKNVLYFESKKVLLTLDESELDEKLLSYINRLVREKSMILSNLKNLRLKNGSPEIARKIIELSE